MAGFSDDLERALMQLLFNNVALTTPSTTVTTLWGALHTGDPADAGTQGTNEGGYAQYTRISVARTTGGWVVTNNSVSPVANIDFPQNTSTSTGTFTHFSIGVTSASTAGMIIAAGTISPNISFSQNVTPRLTTASSFTLD